jgi:hypothetical protein
VKERTRSTTGKLPFQECMPDQMIVRLLYFVVMWMNGMPAENGASCIFSPREIVTGLKLDFVNHCKYLWGSYVEASEDAEITNTLRSRTFPYASCWGLLGTHKDRYGVLIYNPSKLLNEEQSNRFRCLIESFAE